MKLKVIGSGPWASVYRSLLPMPEHTGPGLPDAAIIVSKSHQHHPDTLQYLRWKIPCLVEKPFAMSVAQCEEMIACAEDNGTYLAAALVLKFDRRIEAFRPHVGNYVKIIWTDPCNGRYDATVPVECDVLPHISSIIDTLVPGEPILCSGISYGGRGREIRLQSGKVTFDVHLERDSWKRQRIIDTGGTQGGASLNFSALPEDHNPLHDLIAAFMGRVTYRPAVVCGSAPAMARHREWQRRKTFLSTDLALRACRVTEDVLSMAERCRPSVEAYAGP